MICPAGKTTGLYASAEVYCSGLKIYVAVVLYARAADRSAPRRPGRKGGEQFVDCGYEVENDHIGLGGYTSLWRR